MEVLRFLDAYRIKYSKNQAALVEKHLLWAKICELIPEIEQVQGLHYWEIDYSDILKVKIVEKKND